MIINMKRIRLLSTVVPHCRPVIQINLQQAVHCSAPSLLSDYLAVEKYNRIFFWLPVQKQESLSLRFKTSDPFFYLVPVLN
jgi:hypothetical protein